jgi:hypothetical protein
MSLLLVPIHLDDSPNYTDGSPKGNDCQWCPALQARDWQTIESLSDEGARCTCEAITGCELCGGFRRRTFSLPNGGYEDVPCPACT